MCCDLFTKKLEILYIEANRIDGSNDTQFDIT